MEQHLLWKKDRTKSDKNVHKFLSSIDIVLDQHLFLFDIKASKAHAIGLNKISILSDKELGQINNCLDELASKFSSGKFKLDSKFEDCHSAIESYLCEKLGELGQKIHTGRSRNDQVLVAMRLYMLDTLSQIKFSVINTAKIFLKRAHEEMLTPMPGYTHLQRAVPSSVGLWLAGFLECFIDNLELLNSTSDQLSSSPLGTAAGYGVNLSLDRNAVAKELSLKRLQINPMAAQNSRGKTELQLLFVCSQIMRDIRRLAWDLSLYSTSEFDFVSLPEEYSTGSSIMPNKKNPDVVELLRASPSVVEGAQMEIQSILSLPSGYHRDLQGIKAPLIRAIEHSHSVLAILPGLVSGLSFKSENMLNAIDSQMFATDQAINLAKSGVPFRKAYKESAKSLEGLKIDSLKSLRERVSPGAMANPCLDELEKRLNALS